MKPPRLLFQGRTYAADELASWATGWAEARDGGATGRPQGLPMSNEPESIALLFALLAGPDPVVPLPPDPREWAALGAACPGLRLHLTPAQRDLSLPAERAGLEVAALPPAAAGPALDLPWRAPALLSFTSGSTGARRCVARDPRALLASAAAIAAHFGLARGAGVLGVLPLAAPHGLVNSLLVASSLDAELGLLPGFEPRGALALFATGRFGFWAGTPIMADLLARTPLDGAVPPSPAVVKLSGGRLPESVFQSYRARFGVPPRPAFGTTEHGVLTADAAPEEQVRPDAVGQALPGVEIGIGGPAARATAEEIGPVWARTPWPMLGFGWPPAPGAGDRADGWRPTGDLGALDAAGALRLAGRADDCFKTASGHLVEPATVARAVTELREAEDAVVLPLAGALGGAIGLLVQGTATELELRRHLAAALPAWAQPRVVVVRRELPRLRDGKADRLACLRLLEEAR